MTREDFLFFISDNVARSLALLGYLRNSFSIEESETAITEESRRSGRYPTSQVGQLGKLILFTNNIREAACQSIKWPSFTIQKKKKKRTSVPTGSK